MIYLIADTNFFIQYKKYDEVNFQELFDDKHDEFTLLIPKTVLSELDKHKNQGNDRVSRKARSMIPLLREIMKGPSAIDIHNYKLTIDRLKYFNKQQKNSTHLDLNNPDEKIIDEVLNWKSDSSNENVVLITGDIGMCSLCYDFDIPYIELPETWLLPPEQDKQKKELEKLRKELIEYKNAAPIIDVIPEHLKYKTNIKKIDYLTDVEITDLANYLVNKFPMKQDIPQEGEFNLNFLPSALSRFYKITYPSDTEIEKYQYDYDIWLNSIKEKIEGITSEVKANSKNLFTIELTLKNTGQAYAEDLFVSIKSTDDIFLCASREDANNLNNENYINELVENLLPPLPPTIKETNHLTAPFLNSNINISLAPNNYSFPEFLLDNKKDDFKFYFANGKPKKPVENLSYSCAKFRHGSEENFEFTIVIPDEFNSNIIKLTIEIVAKNLIKPQQKMIIINLEKNNENLIKTNIKKGIDSLGIEKYY